MFELLTTNSDPYAALYCAQAAICATIAAISCEGPHHSRLALCHWLSGAIYLAFGAMHSIQG